MKKHLVIGLMLTLGVANAQTITLNPTVTPALFNYNDQITVTYDVTNKAPLNNLTNAWIWVWIPGKNLNAKYNLNPATAAADPAKFIKSNNSGIITWSITFKPSDFFNADISNEIQLGMLLKASDWPGGQTSDYLANFGFRISLKEPTAKLAFVQPSEVINIQAEAPVSANFKLYVNEVLTDTQNSILNYSYLHTIVASPGYGAIRISATRTTGGDPSEVSFQYVIKANSPVEARPNGIIAGINYDHEDPAKAILCLWAPGKTSVYVLGDFSDWEVLPTYIMKKDGEHFWIELSGLTSGQEYGYQYLVDETIRMADPYSDKILDPDDQYIPTASYPSLKPYPAKALSPPAEWYKNRVSILQTNQTPYAWQELDFIKPNKEGLVIYELLLRDFFESGQRNYQTLIDTLSYFKRLGINAIQLMPIMEFNGNEGWGYNPTFMFAPDKYYGTKNKLKEFIDQCHQNGIAVILDIAMNHQDIPNSYAMMDFDFTTFKPTASNKWFNVSATHPFSVFNDLNHESAYTKKYLDTVNYYWLHEYKVDGFRFDLSKGFTQTNNPNNVSAWSAYDLSRIMLLKRMADKIWANFPDAYIILEHLADNAEEKELAEYRTAEGKGMMLWGKMTDPYNQNTMGYADNSDISWVYHVTRGWTVPNVVGYMESHDEERLMVKNIQFGNATAAYSVKDIQTGLARMKAANLFFYTLPGPKMLWQFGELGYDQSINLCPDGTISSNCRLSPKPVKWSYRDEPGRHDLLAQTADVIRLRNTYSLFTKGEAVLVGGNSLVKQISLKNNPFVPLPVNADQMNAHMVANFDIVTRPATVNLSHAGTWYNYYSGTSVDAANGSLALSLEPGQYYLFTDYPIENQIITQVSTENQWRSFVYPNPVYSDLFIELVPTRSECIQVKIQNVLGQQVLFKEINEGVCRVDVHDLQPGLFIVEIHQGGRIIKARIVKK